MEVKAMDLMKTLSYQPCFKLVDGTVNIFLYSKNPPCFKLVDGTVNIFLYSKNSLAPNSLSVGR